ncbi:MAG: class I SAM-dependent methyltransferase [Acidobacteria bacterium]|nr:class I SAM-dependent methyltransferase [Acidobacteriota bacterium]
MAETTDWNALWKDLVEIKANSRKRRALNAEADIWADRAHDFKESVKKRWVRPDSSREFILSKIDADSTVLDIGAGTGAWSILMAPHAKHVTAVEASGAMIGVMRESLLAENIANVSIIPGSWPDVPIEPHDFSLCSHAMYDSTDLAAFIRRMVACTRRLCFLLLRAPSLDGIRVEAARHIWNKPFDSPNFIIAYNILLQLGIYANVQMEDTGLWKPRKSSTLQEALADMRRFLGLEGLDQYDDYLMNLLRRRLVCKDGQYIWPSEVRSALVYWQAGD